MAVLLIIKNDTWGGSSLYIDRKGRKIYNFSEY